MTTGSQHVGGDSGGKQTSVKDAVIGGSILTGLLGTPVGLFVVVFLGFPGGCKSDYETGTRVGHVVSTSKGGLVWQTMKGKLNEGVQSIPDSDRFEPDTFSFMVADEKLFAELRQAADGGYPVVVAYRKWWIRPLSHSSRYTATEVKRVATE